MPSYEAKPDAPEWQADLAPAGCKLYVPLSEGAGTSVRDYASGVPGAFAGAPTWGRGVHGGQVGGFTATAGVEFPGIVPQIMGTTYPCWMAALVVIAPGTAIWNAFCQTWTGRTGDSFAYLQVDSPTSALAYVIRGSNTSEAASSATGLSLADGKPHLVMGVSYVANGHRLYVDGREVASATSTVNTFASSGTATLTLGYFRTSGNFGAAAGASGVWVGAGNGAVPDPRAMAEDLLSGEFAAIRPRVDFGMLAAALAPATIYYAGAAQSAGSTAYYAF